MCNLCCRFAQGFIQRAGPEILVRDLPPKREYVLGFAATETQRQLLKAFFRLLEEHGKSKSLFRDKEVGAHTSIEHGTGPGSQSSCFLITTCTY